MAQTMNAAIARRWRTSTRGRSLQKAGFRSIETRKTASTQPVIEPKCNTVACPLEVSGLMLIF
jgi:hypothetical protein